ncbi:MAG: Rpn family recombination-promoting nuclease/putative transposase [Oscillospiraceae bacterium]|nr:Rpn family recombination-promoting nuclease/putative transposase [Oscillospiraceae bacterium]
MAKLRYTFKNDVLFKKLFVDHPELLKRLVSVMLSIPLESIEEFDITNPESPPEIVGDKFCRIDINMIVNGTHVNLEIQVHNDGDFEKRLMYYWAREYSSSLKEGGHYVDLPPTIIISIVGFKMFRCGEYYSRFQALEVKRYEQLSDVMDIHIYELVKLPEVVTLENKRELWLHLFDAETEEDLKKIEVLEVPEMTQAINAYRSVTVSPEFLALQRMRDDQKHNEASALHSAELRGEQRGEQRGIQIGKLEGMLEGRYERDKEIAVKMILRGATDVEILGLTDYLTAQDIRELRILA